MDSKDPLDIQIAHTCTYCEQQPNYITYYASGDIEADKLDGTASGVELIGVDSKGIFLRGLLSSSIVIPSSFVMPTTGGSPFLTNSYMPENKLAVIVPIERLILTWHFVPG